jgi:hypothetical protein
MLAYKLFGSGLNTLSVAAMTDVATGLTAAGTTQGDAYEVTTAKAFFSTVGAGSGAVLDDQAAPGDEQFIYNGATTALNIYPPSGAAISPRSSNEAITLPQKTGCIFFCISSSQWVGVLSA